ncbi:MAG: 3-phosphoshikimate 1-carboxyvinyltransferase [Candidatus Omnitrophica bacterium]|nr:3-phosphoshikimate 1-carboxyvinyltransferase [Candidatus Omnitrophota bacterium]MDD5352774.1 3-phosphoshikimate 1-carboxyvinyltransferase [Candidatus Omnitrophota bacterium]MDD5550373.1 3-phosphoshikimate 1-carboxyvinyltransferase [Candidatus Omnitrophota bacterium]
MSYLIKPCRKIQGCLDLRGDKSISHRAVILGSIAKGRTLIKNFSLSEDCQATLRAFKSLGVKIEKKGKDTIVIYGQGFSGLKEPKQAINLGESGTSMRMLIGLLSTQNFESKLSGEKSLFKRPMLRVIRPLRLMGADIKARKKGRDEYPPILISPANLRPINFKMYIASAQVKSAVLLAGLYARGTTKIYEPVKSRDHTERMLKLFGADIDVKGKNISISPSELISPRKIYIPGDISSASFFMVLACLLKKSCIRINNVSLNPSRCGVINALKKMGADINIIYKRKNYFEPMVDIVIKSSNLKGIVVAKDIIPSLIDELPILMVAASLAKGRSVFEGIGELKVKETDRIKSMVSNLSRMGAKIKTQARAGKETIVIEGVNVLKGANLRSFGDHRTAMSMIIAALCADSPSRIDDVKCISKSFPDFLKILNQINKL